MPRDIFELTIITEAPTGEGSITTATAVIRLSQVASVDPPLVVPSDARLTIEGKKTPIIGPLRLSLVKMIGAHWYVTQPSEADRLAQALILLDGQDPCPVCGAEGEEEAKAWGDEGHGRGR